MKKKVVFHIGLPKTDTTAIQTFFATHADHLERNGFFYPIYPEMVRAGLRQPHHTPLLATFLPNLPPHLEMLDLDLCRKQTAQILDRFEKSASHTLIFSHESFFQNHALKEGFADQFDAYDIEVVAYLRRLGSGCIDFRDAA